MIAAPFAASIDPPIPCTTRAARSISSDCAAAANAVATVNRAKPVTYSRLRPYRSPRRPIESPSPTLTKMNVSGTQSTVSTLVSNSAASVGSATLTMELSIVERNTPNDTIPSAR